MVNDAQKFINIVENFPITSLDERDAMQYALTCMKTHVSRKQIDDMVAEAQKVSLVMNLANNDCRMKTPTEVKDEMLAIIHKYCG